MPVKFKIVDVKDLHYDYGRPRFNRERSLTEPQVAGFARYAEQRYPNMFGGDALVIPIGIKAYAGRMRDNDAVLNPLFLLCAGTIFAPSVVLPIPNFPYSFYSTVDVNAVQSEKYWNGVRYKEVAKLGALPYSTKQQTWITTYLSPIGFIPIPGKSKFRWCGYGDFPDKPLPQSFTEKIWASDVWRNFVIDSVATVLMKREPGYYKHLYYTKINPEAAFVP
jgi:hypothetical protein